MSMVEYTKCDGRGCGNVTPDEPGQACMWVEGWSRLTVAGCDWDLCPECTKKALEAVGIKKD